MAEVHKKSTLVTNMDAIPRVYTDPRIHGAALTSQVQTYRTEATDDSIGSTYRMLRVPSRARMSMILLSSDGADATIEANLGVYRTAEDGGAVVDADLFGSALALDTATAGVNVLEESAQLAPEERIMPLWQAAGMSADPDAELDIVFTVTAAATTAVSDLTLEAIYALDA